jgi:purine-nucleoside phosphorylase
MKPGFSQRVAQAATAIRAISDFRPDLALVTGTGLGPMLDQIEVTARIPYGDITGFPVSTAPGHAGELLLGTLSGRNVVAQNGRFHLYEGWSADDIVLPVYVMRALGAARYVVTNAAGGLNPDLRIGDAVLITDQINMTGLHPLSGPNDDALGPRFPDMSRAYDPDLQRAALKTRALPTGIYAAIHGPEFETSAERRFLRAAGGDLVGMSTALEVIAANHAGMQVLGFSVVTNSATGGPDQQPDTLEEVLENAATGAREIRAVLLEMLESGVL